MENVKRQHTAGDVVDPVKEDESNTCQICFSVWATHGEHQLCSLRCGHFFGLSCIRRTLKDQGRTSKRCPMCSQPAKEQDVRLHYAVSSISAKDVSLEEDLKAQINQERAARIEAEMAAGRAKARADTLEAELKTLKATKTTFPVLLKSDDTSPVKFEGSPIATTRKASSSAPDSINRINLSMLKSRAACWISDERGAVVATYVSDLKKYKLVAVHPEFPSRSRTPGGGNGHDHPIRDIALQDSNAVCYGGTVATASLDGTVRLISSTNLNEVCCFNIQEPVWSVAFLRDNALLVGTAKGKVLSLDPRMSKSAVSVLYTGSEPVHSIVKTHYTDTACVASFTRMTLLNARGDNFAMEGMSSRYVGDQYSSIATTIDGLLAISIRSQTDNVIDVGSINLDVENGLCSFHSQRKYHGQHGRPSGRIACFDIDHVMVPDETSKVCCLYPGGRQVGLNESIIAGAYFCGNSSLSMLISSDLVQFVRI